MPKVIFLDLDDTLADFTGAVAPENRGVKGPPEMRKDGFFRNLKVVKGAREFVDKLLADDRFEVFIGSKPTKKNLNSATEKYEWVKEHFPELLPKIVLVCDKKLLNGDYLVDDDARWESGFKGKFLKFNPNCPEKCFRDIIKTLEKEVKDV
jgi:5'(3')-deoxyribonucleotidase